MSLGHWVEEGGVGGGGRGVVRGQKMALSGMPNSTQKLMIEKEITLARIHGFVTCTVFRFCFDQFPTPSEHIDVLTTSLDFI